jgi:hypothetical protein
MGEIFNEPVIGTTTIWEVSQSAVAYSQNALACEKTMHIGLKWLFLKAHAEYGTIMHRNLPCDQMVADMFIQLLLGPALTRHRSAILGGGANPMQCFIP